MSHENAASAAAVNNRFNANQLLDYTAGQLLHHLEGELRADDTIQNGGDDGLIRSLEQRPQTRAPHDLIRFQPGAHSPRDLDIAATLSNGLPVVEVSNDWQKPRKLHLVVEHGNRYEGSTGNYSLPGLARLAVAMTAIAAEKANAKLQMIFVEEGREPVRIDDDETDPLTILQDYDEFVSSSAERRQTAMTGDALATGLDYLADDDDAFMHQSDVALVVSDFLMGSTRDEHGKLEGFKWGDPLHGLESQLGDRLYAVRLQTPSQTDLPFAPVMHVNGRARRIDPGEYPAMRERYQAAAAEQQVCVNGLLERVRTLRLDSQTEQPFMDVADYIFGTPKEV